MSSESARGYALGFTSAMIRALLCAGKGGMRAAKLQTPHRIERSRALCLNRVGLVYHGC